MSTGTEPRRTAWLRAPVALLRLGVDGTVLDANAALLAWVGLSVDEVVGRRRLPDLLSVGGRIYWETHVAPLLAMQRRVEEVALELVGPDGRTPVLMAATVREVAADAPPEVDVALSPARERARYERELVAARRAAETAAQDVRLLQVVTAALSSAYGVDGVAEVLLATGRERLGAAEVIVWTADERGRLVRFPGRAGAGGGAGAPAGRDTDDRVGDRGASPPPDDLLRRPVHVADDGTVTVPLQGRTRRHGAWVLRPRAQAGDEPWDAEVLAATGRQAGAALDRALLFDQRTTAAHVLQQALLTTPDVRDPRAAVATVYRPGVDAFEVGGDWYDVLTFDGGTLRVVVGDVVGRGLEAATAMAQLRSAVRAAAEPGESPAGVVGRLDRFAARTAVGLSATVAYAELDLATGVARYAVAGHLPPLHLPAVGPGTYLWGGRALPLGVGDGGPLPEGAVTLAAGDRLLLFTDGLVERRDRSLPDGLEDLAARARGLAADGMSLDRLVDVVTGGGGGDHDDVCALLLTWAGPLAA
ncbi:SpoIIE family protein phosphatase [Cellulomonas sp. 179-A 9B4 NHS]|uniref:SpoIIE family protein phosphatase n=1 Tax=Cellulomonas sp. 179-A 9B4 NHS TaxID=3142379 RepID=UPI0039A0E71C